MKTLFLVVLCALIISPALGITVQNPRYSGSLAAGANDSFSMGLYLDKGESVQVLNISMDSGNCSDWLTVPDKILVQKESTPISALIAVPRDAVNGFYQCRVRFIGEARGMITPEIQVPISINVTGGRTPAPMTTTEPEPITTEATPEPEPVTTMPTETPALIPTTAAQPAAFPAIWYALGALGAVFVVVMVHDIRRERK